MMMNQQEKTEEKGFKEKYENLKEDYRELEERFENLREDSFHRNKKLFQENLELQEDWKETNKGLRDLQTEYQELESNLRKVEKNYQEVIQSKKHWKEALQDLKKKVDSIEKPPQKLGYVISVDEDEREAAVSHGGRQKAVYNFGASIDQREIEELDSGQYVKVGTVPMQTPKGTKPMPGISGIWGGRKAPLERGTVKSVEEGQEFYKITLDTSRKGRKVKKVKKEKVEELGIEENLEVDYLPANLEIVEVGQEIGGAQLVEESTDITYDDIGGLERQKEKVREMVEYPLRSSEKFEELGVEPPRGILLHGPPGCGKTMLAKAVANESEANYISTKGPELMDKYVGESERHVREIFEKAESNSPSIVFFDELEGIASDREDLSEVGGRVVSQLLSEMDGLDGRGDVAVMAATNRLQDVDEALRRPGRFDREILVPAPANKEDRREILEVHSKDMKLSDEIDLDELAEKTYGFTGADLAKLCREAGMKAVRRYMGDE